MLFYVSVYLFTLDFYFMRPGLARPLAWGGQGRPGGAGNVTWAMRDTRALAH